MPQHRFALARSVAGGGLDLLVNNASVLGPSPLPCPRRVLDQHSARRVRRQRPRAACADPAAARVSCARPTAASSTSAPTPPSRPTRAGAATGRRRRRSTSGRLSLAEEEPRLRVYAFDPGDMRTDDAPGRLPRRGHLRPARARDGGPGSCAGLLARASSKRPLPRREPGRSRGMTAMVTDANARIDFELPPNAEATMPPERRGLERDEVRLMVARPTSVAHTRFRHLPDHLRRRRPRRRQHLRDAGGGAAGLARTRARQRSCTSPASSTTGAWLIELRARDNAGPASDVRLGERIELAGGARLQVQASYPIEGDPRVGCGARCPTVRSTGSSI